MFPLSKILLPIDFSERCLGAARYAEALASRFDSELSFVHVLEPVRYGLATMESGMTAVGAFTENIEAQTREELERFQCEGLERFHVRRVLLEGDAAHMIVKFARDEQMDLIAMPTHGYGPFRRFILGSVTAKVLHDADCPVLTGVHLEEAAGAEAISFRTIACAVDLGPQSRKALCWAAQLASEFGARLVLVHAVPCIEAHAGEYFDPALAGDISKGAQLELEKLASGMHADAEIVVQGGDAPKVVCAAAGDVHADLLVIGRGSAAGLFGRLRANAYAIIRGSPCGVVSV